MSFLFLFSNLDIQCCLYEIQKSSGFKICIKESSVFIYLFCSYLELSLIKTSAKGLKLLYRFLSLTRYFNAALV